MLRELKGGTKGNQELVHIGHCWAEMTCVHFIQWEDNVIRFKKLLSFARQELHLVLVPRHAAWEGRLLGCVTAVKTGALLFQGRRERPSRRQEHRGGRQGRGSGRPRPACSTREGPPSSHPTRSGQTGGGGGGGRTVAVGVHGAEVRPALLHGLLEVLGRLRHDPALQLLGADLPVSVHVHPAGRHESDRAWPRGTGGQKGGRGSTGSRKPPRTATHPAWWDCRDTGLRKGTGLSGAAGARGRCTLLPVSEPQEAGGPLPTWLHAGQRHRPGSTQPALVTGRGGGWAPEQVVFPFGRRRQMELIGCSRRA